MYIILTIKNSIILFSNSHTRETELKNIELWTQDNNLKLNRAKSLEIIFQNNRREIHTDLPPTLTGNRSHDSNQNARRLH